MGNSEDYAAALTELEQLHAAGKIDQGRYEVHRARLLDEAKRPLRAVDVARNLVVSALIVLAFMVLLMAIVNS